VIEAHSSVAVVLYHKDLDAFLLVRQFRPAVYSCRLREAKEAGQPAPDRAAGLKGGEGGRAAALFLTVHRQGCADEVLLVGGAHCGCTCSTTPVATLPTSPFFFLPSGFTIELCAGLIDKAKTLKEIVSEEILEEVGYRVEPSEVHELSAAVAAAGVNGSTSHQFYALVSEKCVREWVVVGGSEV
jgi:hypothetical protein